MLKIKILIPNYKYIEPNDGAKPYHVYTIHVNIFLNGNSGVYFLEKRYSDFLLLHNTVRRQYETPEFPPKRVRNTRVKVLESRRIILEQYLQIMSSLVPIPSEIVTFLNVPTHQRDCLNLWNRRDSDDLSSEESGSIDIFLNPVAAFFEDPFLDSDSNSNLSDSITRGVLDALYHS